MHYNAVKERFSPSSPHPFQFAVSMLEFQTLKCVFWKHLDQSISREKGEVGKHEGAAEEVLTMVWKLQEENGEREKETFLFSLRFCRVASFSSLVTPHSSHRTSCFLSPHLPHCAMDRMKLDGGSAG